MPHKKWIITGTLAVAAAIAFVAMQGPKLGNEGTPGAIGAAKRYESPQIGGGDVSLDDTQIATFIQSDVFHKLATDASFREAARSEAFGRFIGSEGLREASAKVDVAAVMRDAAFRDLLKSDVFARALDQGKLSEALRTADLAQLTEAGRLSELLRSEALRELALREEFQRLAEAAAVQEARSITDLSRIAESMGTFKDSEAFRTLEGNRAFQEAVKGGFLDMFRTAEGARFATEDLRQLAELKSFTEAARVEGFGRFVEGMRRTEDLGAVRDVAGSEAMLAVLTSEAYREAALRSELGRLAEAGRLTDALARVSAE